MSLLQNITLNREAKNSDILEEAISTFLVWLNVLFLTVVSIAACNKFFSNPIESSWLYLLSYRLTQDLLGLLLANFLFFVKILDGKAINELPFLKLLKFPLEFKMST